MLDDHKPADTPELRTHLCERDSLPGNVMLLLDASEQPAEVAAPTPQAVECLIRAATPRAKGVPSNARDGLGEAFANWFGESKVVDATGAPLVVYHGTLKDFSEFRLDRTMDGGFHFGTTKAANERTEDLDEPRGSQPVHVMPLYLSIRNPMRTTDPWDDEDAWEDKIRVAKERGHDGIVYRNAREDAGQDSWIAFSPDQIKSAIGNPGTYRLRSSSITDHQMLENAHRALAFLGNVRSQKRPTPTCFDF